MFSKKYFIGGIVAGIVLLFSYLLTLPDGKLHIVFCNVGQGDGAYIRFPDNQDMVIDGGPDNSILRCLGKYMPFYDRTIDMVVLSHPQKDHMQGVISVVERYTVKNFIIGEEGNTTAGYRRLIAAIEKNHVSVRNLFTGDTFYLGDVRVDVIWPERKWVAAHVRQPLSNLSYLSNLREGQVLGLSTDTDLNQFSYFLDIHYGDFSALFTGDGDQRIDADVIHTGKISQVKVLKFPHHGSKTAITPALLDGLDPELAVISVGKNGYGHPTKEALDLLTSRNILIKRTDESGDIEVVSDGRGWWETKSKVKSKKSKV